MGASQVEPVNPISPLLQPVLVTENEWTDAKECPTYYSNKDSVFTHAFIQKEIEKYHLTLDGCDKCSAVMRHFVDPRALMDHMAIDNIIWVPFPHSIQENPAPGLQVPLWDPQNIHVQLNPHRPRGYIQLKHFTKPVNNNQEFIKIGKSASLSVLKSLKS